jgi:hypothetical protein
MSEPDDKGWDERKSFPQVPTIDMDEPGEVEYVHYRPEDTKVVSGPMGPVKQFPGRRFMSKRGAMAYWTERAGRIIQDLSVSGRWIFRVRRDA